MASKRIIYYLLGFILILVTVKILTYKPKSSEAVIKQNSYSHEQIELIIKKYEKQIDIKNKEIFSLKKTQIKQEDTKRLDYYYLEKYPEISNCKNMNLKRWNPLKTNETVINDYSRPANRLLQNTTITRGSF